MPKSKETPAQKIKRLERELSDEKLKNKVLNTMIDLSDQQYGTSIRKKYWCLTIKNISAKRTHFTYPTLVTLGPIWFL